MNLVAVCDFRKTDLGDPIGGFFFRGKSVIEGVAEHQENPSGTYLYLDSMKFINEDGALRAFKLPGLTDSSRCWSRKVKIELTRLLIMEGGSDQDGEWAIKYRVLKTGALQSCIPE